MFHFARKPYHLSLFTPFCYGEMSATDTNHYIKPV